MLSSTTKTILGSAMSVPVAIGALTAAPAHATEAAPDTTQTTTQTTTESTTTSSKVSAKGKASRASRAVAPSRSRSPHKFGTVKYNQWYAFNYMEYKYNWGKNQRASLRNLWNRESGWSQHAHNGSSGAHGIPQSLPGSKMASHGKNWRTNPETQIKWGLSYIKGRYGTPNGAWRAFQSKGWY